MKVSTALLGSIALVSSALASLDAPQPVGLVVAERDLKPVHPVAVSIEQRDVDSDLEKRVKNKSSPKKIPVKQTPAKETPVKQTPAKETPVKQTPAKETPAKETPAKETPDKQTPAKEKDSLAKQPPSSLKKVVTKQLCSKIVQRGAGKGTGAGATKPKSPIKVNSKPKKQSRGLQRLGDGIAAYARSLFSRATETDNINHSEQQLVALRETADPVTEAFSPNDMDWHKWDNGKAFDVQVDGLEGCTVVFVASPMGIYTWHLWEHNTFRASHSEILPKEDEAQFQHLALEQVALGKADTVFDPTGQGESPTYYHGQFGLKSPQVPSNAWTGSPDDIYIGIMTPNHLPTADTASTWDSEAAVYPSAQWGSKFRYGTPIRKLVDAIKKELGAVPDANIKAYGYHATKPAPKNKPAGLATVSWDQTSYALYAENEKLFEIKVGAVGEVEMNNPKKHAPADPKRVAAPGTGTGAGGKNCDKSSKCKGNCCIVQ